MTTSNNSPSAELVERVVRAMLEPLSFYERDDDCRVAIDDTDDLATMARAAIAAMQPEIDAAYKLGFEAGQRVVDDAVDTLDDEAFIDYMRKAQRWDGSGMYWELAIRAPKGPTKTRSRHISYGEGPTRIAAILDACKKAKEASNE